MKDSLVLSIDIGSSSVRVALFNEAANVLRGSTVSISHSFQTTNSGGSEMDANELFDRLVEAIDGVVAKTKGDVATVAMCSFWHSLVGVDARGRPTTPVMTWADTQSREYTPMLRDRFDERLVHNRTGAHFHSSFWPAKLLWMRQERTDEWKRTARLCSLSDLIAMRLFGESVTSISMASATGIFDQRKCDWDSELLRFLKVKRERLPRIASDGESFKLTGKFALRWPQLARSRWFPAVGDGAADNIGSGCTTREKAALMVGTSAAMRVAFVGKVPSRIPVGLWCYRIDGTRVIIGGALSDGGNLYALIKDRFKLRGDIELQLESRAATDELVVIPFFHGERSTGYDENARGAIIGLTADHDGLDVLRAAMEGVAFRLDDIYRRLNKIAEIETIVASGGALRRSPVWRQIIANVLGREINCGDARESSLRGAALLALESTGKM